MNGRRKKWAVPARDDAPGQRIALLLAGGDGMRLRDLTREITGEPIPKQYCRLYNNKSLLEATIARTRLYAPFEDIHIIINQAHIDLAMDQVYKLPRTNIFVQPENRDTGPGLIFSLLQLKMMYRDPVVAIFPTDHYINNDHAFIAHVQRATELVTRMPDKIAVLGITPDRPETGYGYLLPESPVRTCEKTYYVKSFSEKPNLSNAYRIVALGGLWNTFVMVFKLSTMLNLLTELVPERLYPLSGLVRSPARAAEVYQTLDSWNFSKTVLTRIPEHIIMLEIDDVSWSDWGTREAIERTYRNLNLIPFWKAPLHQPIEIRSDSSKQPSDFQFIA